MQAEKMLPLKASIFDMLSSSQTLQKYRKHIQNQSRCGLNLKAISNFYILQQKRKKQLASLVENEIAKLQHQTHKIVLNNMQYYFVVLLWDELFLDIGLKYLLFRYLRLLTNASGFHRILVEWLSDLTPTLLAIRVGRCNQNLQNQFQKLADPEISEEGRHILYKEIQSIGQFLRLMYESNKENQRIDPQVFVNKGIAQYFEVMDQFAINLEGKSEGNMLKYPFLLSFDYKYQLIQIESMYEQNVSMKKTLSQGFNQLVSAMQLSQGIAGLLHLYFAIHRDNLLDDSMQQLSQIKTNLKSPLKIQFIGEQGADQGGLRNQYFQLVTKALFNPYLDMFLPKNQNSFYWFNASSFEPPLRFQFAGMILGLSIYNAVHLDVHFPDLLYKKLLQEEDPTTLQDIKEIQPEIYKGLVSIMKSTEPLQPLELYFIVDTESFGVKTFHQLVEDGNETQVTQDNKQYYCMSYVDFILNKHIEKQFIPFKKGFKKVVSGQIIGLFEPWELKTLICGIEDIDFEELRQTTNYEGYTAQSAVIVAFWNILQNLNKDEKKAFLFFATGTDRVPIEGLKSLKFMIQRHSNINHLPTAHTCFNVLLLPQYQSRQILQKNIKLILQHNQGFGLI